MKRLLVFTTLLFIICASSFADVSMSGDVKIEYCYGSGKELSSNLVFNLKPEKGVTIVVPFSCKDSMQYEVGKIKFTAKKKSVKYTLTIEPLKGVITDSKLTGDKWSIDLVKANMYGEYAVSRNDYVYDEVVEDFKVVLFNNTTGKKKKKDGMTFQYSDYSLGLSADDLSFQTSVIKIGDFSLRSSVIAQVMDGSDNLSFSASVDFNPEAFDFYVAFDSRKTKDFNYDAVARFLSDTLNFEFYYASRTTRPSKAFALKEYLSFFSSMEIDKIIFHFGMKDMLKTNMSQTLCLGAYFESDSTEVDVSSIYNIDEKILVVGCRTRIDDIVPNVFVNASANIWNQNENSILTGKVGAGYLSKDYDLIANLYFLKQTDAQLLFGVGLGAEFKTLVKNVKVEANLKLDTYGAANLSTIAETARQNYSSIVPHSFLSGGNTFSITCTYTF